MRESKKLKELGGTYALGSGHVPHITLYRATFPVKNLPAIKQELRQLMAEERSFMLRAGKYRQSALGYVDVPYAKTKELLRLQRDIAGSLNPLREGVVNEAERRNVAKTSERQMRSFDRFGYDFVGTHFVPHLTLTKFKTYHEDALEALVPHNFSFKVAKIALFKADARHVCRERLATFVLHR